MTEPTLSNQIVAAIAATNDNAQKTVLLLMLAVLEEIGAKLDDLQGLRESVLKEHTENHDSDHYWVLKRRAEDGEREAIYVWAKSKMLAELEDAKDRKTDWRAFRSKIVDGIAMLLIGAAAAVAGIGWVIK